MPKTSILVEKQLPSFISEESTKFVTFLEKYYEFMELPTYSVSADSLSITTDVTDITVDYT